MRWNIKSKSKVIKTEWHSWFAWHAVDINGQRIIWEKVERKGYHGAVSCAPAWNWEYRTKEIGDAERHSKSIQYDQTEYEKQYQKGEADSKEMSKSKKTTFNLTMKSGETLVIRAHKYSQQTGWINFFEYNGKYDPYGRNADERFLKDEIYKVGATEIVVMNIINPIAKPKK